MKSQLTPWFVPYGAYHTIRAIMESNRFFPMYLYGDTGVGKSMMIKELCSELDRNLIRIQITDETCERDLLGGFSLVNGDTVWQDGPVVKAMKTGSVLLLDEFPAGNTNRIMCLNSVLEGGSVYVKAINEIVQPKHGFLPIATGNTRGVLDMNSVKFLGANLQDESVLDRFSICLEQPFPDTLTEMKILEKYSEHNQIDISKSALEIMVRFATETRESANNGTGTPYLSPRRMITWLELYKIFDNLRESLIMCVSRFGKTQAMGLVDIFDVVQQTPVAPSIPEAQTTLPDDLLVF